MTAKITVVTVVLNRSAALRETIQSVCDQSYPHLDHIVIDGGSTDGTVEVIRAHAGQLAGWLSEPDCGIYEAMNKGWRMADPASYILFLGAGDRLISCPQGLPQPALPPVVFYGRVLLNGGREFMSSANWRLRLYNALHHQGLLVPKNAHPEPPFDLRYRLYADFDFNQRLARQGVRFRALPELVAYAAPGGITAVTGVSEMTQIVRKNYGIFWGWLSAAGFAAAKHLPLLRRLHPVARV